MGKVIKTFNGGSWIYNSKMSSFKNADIVIMPGGSDWGTEYYNHKPIKGAQYVNSQINQEQYELANRAIGAGKMIWGNCKGLQLGTILSGGWLIQDMSHPSSHKIITKDGESYTTNSCHHQMCYPYDLPKDEYELIAWTPQLSNYHIIQGDVQLEFPEISLDENGMFKEPEIIWYPKTKCFGGQFHAEWMSRGKTLDYVNELIREKLNE